MLLTGTGLLSVPQERAQFSLWSMMAAPLLVSTDVRTLSPPTASILTNRDVIAVDQDPAGRQGTRIVDRGAHQVWLRTLADGSHAVLFFNAGSRPATMQLSASRAGVTAPPYRVRDLWRHRTWVSSAAKLDTTVAPNDVVMLRIWPSA
jgi:alpha-galactosidase